MEDSLWSNYPELRRKCIPGTGHSNHERIVDSVGSHSWYDKISVACWSVQTLHRFAKYAGAEPYFSSNISTHSLACWCISWWFLVTGMQTEGFWIL